MGWPRAIAPPFGLTFAGSAPISAIQASATGANASLISTVSISSIDSPARLSACWVAGIGADSIMTGSAPRAEMWCTRARGVNPALDGGPETTSSAAAPSEIWLATPAVSTPSGISVFRPASLSAEVAARPFVGGDALELGDLLSKYPLSIACSARRWLSRAKRSLSSRERPHWSAIISAPRNCEIPWSP